jgi:LysM repeat protein
MVYGELGKIPGITCSSAALGRKWPWKGFVLALLFFGTAAACNRQDSPRNCEARIFSKGQEHLRRGKSELALHCFLSLTRRNPTHSGEAHFECGEIYLVEKNDPLSAIYHYREYLKYSPKNRQTALVRGRIETAEKAYLSQIPVLRQVSQENHGDLLRTLKVLQDENAKLKQLVALSVQQGKEPQTAAIISSEESQKKGIDDLSKNVHLSSIQRYVVVKGDTLSSISLKVYGAASRWREIFDANRSLLRSPTQLKVGLSLAIP